MKILTQPTGTRSRAATCRQWLRLAASVAALTLAAWLGSLAVAAAIPVEVPAETETAPMTDSAGDVQDVLFFGGAQTVLIRLHIQIGTRPLNAAWTEAVAKLHEHLDRNRNASGAESLTRDEGLADLAQVLLGPLAVQAQPSSAAEPDTTFARIDANGDGTLGLEEREQAARVLERYDRNDDESISSAELLAFRDPNSVSLAAAPTERGAVKLPLLLLDRSVSRVEMLQQVLRRFDTGGPGGARARDQRLSRSELRLAPVVFRTFDRDHDGALSIDELLAFLDEGDPAVELNVHLGPRPAPLAAPPALEVVAPRHSGPGPGSGPAAVLPRVRPRLRPGDETRVTIELGDVRLDIRAEDRAWDGDAARARPRYERLFQDTDLDDSKSISLSEARGQEPFPTLFRLMDRNGDGQVVPEEMNSTLALLEALWRGHAVLSFKDRGVLLFGNLDSSGDGRLVPRELHEAPARLASFDRNGDGRVTAAEIPHRFELTLAQGPLPAGFVLVLRGDPADPTAVAPPPRPVSTAGPRWFQQTDRNHDGDLSPREFLGPRALFLRLDADGDGLIDAEEAAAARTAVSGKAVGDGRN